MKNIYEIVLTIFAMFILIIEKSSNFEILVIGMLILIFITLNKDLKKR